MSPLQKQKPQIVRLIEEYGRLKDYHDKIPPLVYARYARSALNLIELCDGDLTKCFHALKLLKGWADEKGLDWSLDTATKRWPELQKLMDKPGTALEPSKCVVCHNEANSLINLFKGPTCASCALK